MNKSISKNIIIYAFKTLVGLLIPMISFPYITRILSVDAIGKVSFSSSIISYFILISGLGIYSYAVKEGAKIKDDEDAWNNFASEIFSLNIITTLIAYIIFFILLLLSDKWSNYTYLLLIISINIFLTTIGVDWIYTIYEEYLYITIRTIIVQIISIIFLFCFVKDDKDIYIYAVYTIFTSAGSNIFNFFYSKKYVKFRWKVTTNTLKYIKPILLLFFSSIATHIYINSDITILGYMTTDSEVGLYNVAVKVYNIAKMVLLSINTVTIARLAYLINNDSIEYKKLFNNLLNVNLIISIPSSIGLIVLSNQVLTVFSGIEYIKATSALSILALSIPFSVLASFIASGCLLLNNRENDILFASVASAIINIVLNFILIPKCGIEAAAATTLIAEILAVCIHIINARKYSIIDFKIHNLLKLIISSLIMFLICTIMNKVINNIVLQIFGTALIGVIVYFTTMIILKYDVLLHYLNILHKKYIDRG